MSFKEGTVQCLRQDPDIIVIGEMRDPDTIDTALEVTDSGHRVFSTLHTSSAPRAIDRFIDVFPPHQQHQVRTQLSTTLEGVLYQALIPRKDGAGRVAAVEAMIATSAIRNLIREGRAYQIMNAIHTGSQDGMQTMNQALLGLYRNGIISREEAMARSPDNEELKELLEGHREEGSPSLTVT